MSNILLRVPRLLCYDTLMKRGSLHTRLLLAVVLLIVILVAGALGIVHYYVGREVRKTAANELTQSASVVRTSLGQYEERLLNRGRLLA